MKGVNGAGLTSVATSDGVYISYLSQGKDPLSFVGVMDMVDGETMDVSVFIEIFLLQEAFNFSSICFKTDNVFPDFAIITDVAVCL